MSAVPGPLAEKRVVDLGSIVAGPFAGRLLDDDGADVMKIEAPNHPDLMRSWGRASFRGHRLRWTSHARNERCITLDLRGVRGRELFLSLLVDIEVVVDDFRPGTLERWNLGDDRWAGPPISGHHIDEVYAELGLDADEALRLADERTI